MQELEAVREAYAEAARTQPPDYAPLAAWHDLPLGLREAFIHVYYAGRRQAAAEARPSARG